MKKLYRSRNDKKLTGICGGLADLTGIDSTLLRILLIVITIFTSGTLLLVYLIAAFIIPKEPPLYNAYGFGGSDPGGLGWNGWQQPNPPSASGFGGGFQPSNVDAVMDDLEKKALRKELEQYRAKLAQYEKGDQ